MGASAFRLVSFEYDFLGWRLHFLFFRGHVQSMSMRVELGKDIRPYEG